MPLTGKQKKTPGRPGTASVNEEWQAAATTLIKRQPHAPGSSDIFLFRDGLASLSQSITNTICKDADWQQTRGWPDTARLDEEMAAIKNVTFHNKPP